MRNSTGLSLKLPVWGLMAALWAGLGAAALHGAGAPAPEFFDVFRAGKDGYPSVRIPAVTVARGGAVLAFAEGRQARRDQAANQIILKRSRDGGRSWGPVQVVAADGSNSLNNPVAVTDLPGGRIFMMYQRIPAHLREASRAIETGYEGTNVYRNLLVWSDDDGATWTRPLDVTRSTKRPQGATTLAGGPGTGIQLTRGPHRGRLIIPFNEGPYWQWNNFAVFSDDHGASWQCGENVPGVFVPDAKLGRRSCVNEAQMVELSDGSVRLNTRQFAGTKVRKTSVSRDGGRTWTPVEDAPELRDPSCNAGLLRYSFDGPGGRGVILFSGPDSAKRDTGTIHLSRDDGLTWPARRVLWPGSFAYSAMIRLADGAVGCLFEADSMDRIVFARVTLDWIQEPAP